MCGIEEPGTGKQIVGTLFGTGAEREGKAVGVRGAGLAFETVASDSARSDSASDVWGGSSEASRSELPRVSIDG